MQTYKIDIDTFENELINSQREEKAREIAEEQAKQWFKVQEEQAKQTEQEGNEEAQETQEAPQEESALTEDNQSETQAQQSEESTEENEKSSESAPEQASEEEAEQAQEEAQEDSESEKSDPLEDKVREILQTINLDEIEVILDDPFAELNEEEMDEELEKLRKKCDSFGNVNLAAMDEYEELRGRFEFLTKQQSDLLEAKSQLMSTINKINRSTRQMFMDTFTKVSEEFRIYFRMLFGGGEAQLVLLDPDNVLESGIDIVARPPGKKLQNISLLSGGEKTLTAIGLIFGVFKVNPSPFCVLDEIDAALDESNVGRFSYLLQDFAKIAQFIVITHNKKTISAADVLYGITMPETGCSRIVSVKLSEKEKEKAVEDVKVGA